MNFDVKFQEESSFTVEMGQLTRGPKGEKGDPGATGPAGIVISSTQPTGDTHPVWLDPDGDADGEGFSLGISSATVGQIAKITAVDSNGAPTAWEAVDMPSGGSGGETWVEILHYVYAASDDLVSIVKTFAAGTYKRLYLFGHIYLSTKNTPRLYINDIVVGAPAVLDSANSGSFRLLIDEFGTDISMQTTYRTPDNEYKWNGNGAKLSCAIAMNTIEKIALFSGHIHTKFSAGTDVYIYGVKA